MHTAYINIKYINKYFQVKYIINNTKVVNGWCLANHIGMFKVLLIENINIKCGKVGV
mgnify:CR=1 FL=1